MSRSAVAVGVVVVLAGAAVAGLLYVKSRRPDLSPAGPNRELAPASLAVYVEMPGLASTWSKMEGTAAWVDLAGSGVARAALASRPVVDLVAAFEQVAAKADYEVTPRNAMKFVGRECSVGLALDPAGGAPDVLVLTKLDVDALVKDLVAGNTEVDALGEELQRRTGKCDFAVTAAEFKGHKIATAVRDGAQYHATLLGDTLAVATDAALLHAAVECRLAGGANSLGRRPEFQADVAASTPGAAVFEWYDLDALDRGRASLDAGLTSLGAKPLVLSAVHGVLDGTRGGRSLARSTSIPDGDLYRATWTYSKSADLFADKAAPVLREFAGGEWLAYWETGDLGGVAAAWNRSSLKRRLGDSEIGRWIDDAIDEPRKRMQELVNSLPTRGAMPDFDVDDEAADLLDGFLLRMGGHLLGEQVGRLASGETCGAMDLDAERPDEPKFVAALRLGTEGRLAALALQAMLRDEKPDWLRSAEAGGRTVFTASKAVELHFALVGDALVVSTDGEGLRAAAASGRGGSAGPGKGVRDGIAALKPGWRGYFYFDFLRLRSASGAVGRDDPSMDMFERMFDLYREMGVFGDRVAYGGYVADDFSSVEVRTVMWPERGAPTAGAPASRDPLVWRSLPRSTFVHAVNTESGVATLWTAAKGILRIAGADLEQVKSSFREAMEMDLEEELLPALGREVSFAVTRVDAGASAGSGRDAPAVLPGFVVGIEVKDAKVVKRALDRAVELAEAAIEESGTVAKVFHRETYGGAQVIRVEIPEDERPPVEISPAIVLADGYLTLSTDLATLHACVDAKNGKAPCLADEKAFADAVASLSQRPHSFLLLDWAGMLDQVAVYAPQMGGLVQQDPVPFPEMPADGDAEEWRNRLAEYHRKVEASRAEAARSGGEKVRRWIDALRVVDFVAADAWADGGVTQAGYVVRFTK